MANKVLIILIGFLIWSCDGVLNQVDIYDCVDNNCIRGYVHDESGDPVSNAYIFLTYERTIIERPSTTIAFSLATGANISIWIESQCNQTILTIIDNVTYGPGAHSISFEFINSEGLTPLDGKYNLHFIAGEETHTQCFYFTNHISENFEIQYNNDCIDENGNLTCEAIAKTNSIGYFEFSQECLSLGLISPVGTDELGNPIEPEILSRLMLFTDDGHGYGSTEFFDVDESQGAEINIYISNE